MTKRKLDKIEKELTEKGLKNVQEQKEKVEEALDMVKTQMNFLVIKRDYEDKVRPFNRAQEDAELKKVLEQYESDIKVADEKIAIMEDQLNNGVEKKENKEDKETPIGVG